MLVFLLVLSLPMMLFKVEILLLVKVIAWRNKKVVDFSVAFVGYEALQRAILEAERHFSGNKTEEIDGSNVMLNDREMMAMLLDLRTLPCNNVETNVRNEAVRLLKLAYVEFGVKCVLYYRRQEVVAKLATSAKTKNSCEEEGASDIVAHKLKAAHGTTLDATEMTFDPIGSWSDDDLSGDGGNAVRNEAKVTIEVLGHKLSAEFEVRIRALRNHSTKLNWSKVDPNVAIRYPSAQDLLELMGLNINALYKRLEEEGGSEFGHLPTMTSIMR